MSPRHASVAVLVSVAATLACVGAWLAAACSSPYDEGPLDAGGLDAPREDGSLDAAGQTGDPCAHVAPPPAPAIEDVPDASLPPIVLAMTDDGFTRTSPTGFDLDGVCTCDERPGAARAGAPSCVSKNPRCDADGGIDNVASSLAAGVFAFFDLESLLQFQIQRGRSNLVLQIVGYDGQPDDRSVLVAALMSDGIQTPSCPDSKQDPFTSLWSPGNCGDDAWSVRPESLLGSVPTVIGRGYVTGGRLVARMTGAVGFPFSEQARLFMPTPLLEGRLVRLGDADLRPREVDAGEPPEARGLRLWSLADATISGRVPTSELLATLGTTRIPNPDGGVSLAVCGQPSWATIARGVCESADVTESAARDFDNGARCDALSWAVPFRAGPARLGSTFTRVRAPDPCDRDAGVDYRCP